MEPRFPLGKTVATPGAMALEIDLASYMHRHHCGDWEIWTNATSRLMRKRLKRASAS
jgi:hypothetical protein